MRSNEQIMQSVNIARLGLPHEDRVTAQGGSRVAHFEKGSVHEQVMPESLNGHANGGIATHPLNLTLLSKKRTAPGMERDAEHSKRMKTEAHDDDVTIGHKNTDEDHEEEDDRGEEKYSKDSILQHFHAFIQRKKDQGEIEPKKEATVQDNNSHDKRAEEKEASPRPYERFAPLFGQGENGVSSVPTSPLRGYGLDYNAVISQHLARTANAPNFLDIWTALAGNAYARAKRTNDENGSNRGPSPPMPPLTSAGNDFDAKSSSASSFTSSPTPINMIPERTMRQNNWAVKVWRDWAIERNSIANLKGKTGPFDIVPMDIKDATMEGMSYWLPRFITEVRRRDKRSYPPDTLMQIASGLQRHLRHVSGRSDITFFDKYSPTFAEFREALKARSEAINMETSVSRRGMDHDIHMNGIDRGSETWPTSLFNLNTAKGLFRAIFYYNCISFHITSMEEHHALTVSQFRTGYDEKTGHEYLEFTRESGEQPVRKYATPYDSRCIVKVFKKYFQHIPSSGLLYKRPLQSAEGSELRFSFNPVGINKLRETFKMLFGGRRTGCQLSGIDADDERDVRRHSAEEYQQRKAERSPGSDASSGVSFLEEKRRRDSGAENDPVFENEGRNQHSPTTSNEKVPTIALDITRPNILVENSNNNAKMPDEDDCLTLKVPAFVKNVIVQQGSKRIKIDLTNMT